MMTEIFFTCGGQTFDETNLSDAPVQTLCGRRQRQTSRRLVCGVSLKFSEIRKPSTQKISPPADSATIKARRMSRGIFAFVNKSCSFAGDFKPIG